MNEYEDDEYEEDSLILSFGKNGAEVVNKKDYEKRVERQQEIIHNFIKENEKRFAEFLEREGISEEEFNTGNIKGERGK